MLSLSLSLSRSLSHTHTHTHRSAIYKEVAFKTALLDVFYLTVMVSWIQLGLSWIFVPLQSLPGFGGIALSDISEVCVCVCVCVCKCVRACV